MPQEKELYTRFFTPIFNAPDHVDTMQTNGLFDIDEKGHFRGLELVAFPGTKLLCTPVSESVYKAKVPSYDRHLETFVHPCFLSPKPLPKKVLPSPQAIIDTMCSFVGTPYTWGGNLPLFPPDTPFSDTTKRLSGFDCSGLLYYATNGLTPRNASQLVSFGRRVKRDEVRPLDMIVWNKHVIFVLNEKEVIESREKDGVIISSLDEALKTADINAPFFLRRWHPTLLR